MNDHDLGQSNHIRHSFRGLGTRCTECGYEENHHLHKSENAEIFWESIGPSGRSFYNKDYVNHRWQDIPLSVRKEISREMNYQQGKINAKSRGHFMVRSIMRSGTIRTICSRCKKTESECRENPVCEGKFDYEKSEIQKGSKLNLLILGMVAGAGGIIAGSVLRKLLIDRGVKASRADPAIQQALETTYRIHNSTRRLIRKGDSITFISSTNQDSSVMDTVNKLNPQGMVENTESLKLGEQVSFGAEHGQIVSLSGNYATIVKDNGETVPVHLRAIMRDSDVIYTKSTGMTTWNLISPRERIEILNKCKLPNIILSKTWQEMLPVARDVIQSEFGRPMKEEYACSQCGDKFGDKAEYEDHKQAHKQKADMSAIETCELCGGKYARRDSHWFKDGHQYDATSENISNVIEQGRNRRINEIGSRANRKAEDICSVCNRPKSEHGSKDTNPVDGKIYSHDFKAKAIEQLKKNDNLAKSRASDRWNSMSISQRNNLMIQASQALRGSPRFDWDDETLADMQLNDFRNDIAAFLESKLKSVSKYHYHRVGRDADKVSSKLYCFECEPNKDFNDKETLARHLVDRHGWNLSVARQNIDSQTKSKCPHDSIDPKNGMCRDCGEEIYDPYEKSTLRTDTTVGVQDEQEQPKEKILGALAGLAGGALRAGAGAGLRLGAGLASSGGGDDDEDKSKDAEYDKFIQWWSKLPDTNRRNIEHRYGDSEVDIYDYYQRTYGSKRKEGMTTGTGGVNNPTYGDTKKPKNGIQREKAGKKCTLCGGSGKHQGRQCARCEGDGVLFDSYEEEEEHFKKSFERISIHGIKQVVGKGQCANCHCIIKDDTDRCPECNASYNKTKADYAYRCPYCGTKHETKPRLRNVRVDGELLPLCPDCDDYPEQYRHKQKGESRCPDCNSYTNDLKRHLQTDHGYSAYDAGKLARQTSKMREQTDLSMIAREANEGYDDPEDTPKEDKTPKTPKPDKTRKPVGSANNEGQVSTQAYEA